MINLQTGKQLDSILDSTARINIWQGSVSSGKTISSLIRWIEFCQTGAKGNLLMVGKTERTLKRNVIDVLSELMDGSGSLITRTGSGEIQIGNRTIYIVGANDERAEAKIRGLTLAGAYGDEVTLWAESFFNMLLSRLRVQNAQMFLTTNPDSPNHWLKKKFLDREDELDIKNFAFELDDNHTLDPKYVQSLKAEYSPASSLWYRRFINGEWVMAEGAVYDCFDRLHNVVNELPKMREYWVGIDYGTTNPFAAILIGEGEDDKLYAVKEYYYDSQKGQRQLSDAEYSRELTKFLEGYDVRRIFVDPSAASFITQLWRDNHLGVSKANNNVQDGIRIVYNLLGSRKLQVHNSCTNLIEEIESYVWDVKQQEKGEDKPLKRNDHAVDALRYAMISLGAIWRHWITRSE
jgi:PBSX family phage terminase large subunit